MFGLSQNIKSRMAFYKSKMPTHGATVIDVMKAYSNPAYSSREASPSFATMEDMKKGGPAKGWYGFPITNPDFPSYPKARDFGKVFGLRCVASGADCEGESRRHNANGYYRDSFQSAVIIPLVFKLPSGKGFIIGHYDSDNGEVYMAQGVHGELWSAYRASHSKADRDAEESRECEAKERAESDISDLQAEIADNRKYVLRLIKEAKSNCAALVNMPETKEAIRHDVTAALGAIRKARKRIEKLQSNYWVAVE